MLRTLFTLTLVAGTLAAQKPVLTESFESGKIDSFVWDTRVTGTATVAVEAAEGGHGQYAHPDMAAASYAFVVATYLPNSVRTHFFGRAYMKVSPGLGTTHNPLDFRRRAGMAALKVS